MVFSGILQMKLCMNWVHRVTYPLSTCRVNVGYQASRACRDSQEGPYLVQRWIKQNHIIKLR